MNPIPTWRESMLNTDPQHPNIAAIKQHAIEQEIDALRQRVQELEATHKCNVETIECQQDEIVALKEDIGGHPV